MMSGGEIYIQMFQRIRSNPQVQEMVSRGYAPRPVFEPGGPRITTLSDDGNPGPSERVRRAEVRVNRRRVAREEDDAEDSDREDLQHDQASEAIESRGGGSSLGHSEDAGTLPDDRPSNARSEAGNEAQRAKRQRTGDPQPDDLPLAFPNDEDEMQKFIESQQALRELFETMDREAEDDEGEDDAVSVSSGEENERNNRTAVAATIIAPAGNLGVAVPLRSEPDGCRVYVCELCVEARPTSEKDLSESTVKDRIIQYINGSVGRVPIDTIMSIAAAEYNKLVYYPNLARGVKDGIKWEPERIKAHFIGPGGRPGHVIDPIWTMVADYVMTTTLMSELRTGGIRFRSGRTDREYCSQTGIKSWMTLSKYAIALAEKIERARCESEGGASGRNSTHKVSALVSSNKGSGSGAASRSQGPLHNYLAARSNGVASIVRESREAEVMHAAASGTTVAAGLSCLTVSNY